MRARLAVILIATVGLGIGAALYTSGKRKPVPEAGPTSETPIGYPLPGATPAKPTASAEVRTSSIPPEPEPSTESPNSPVVSPRTPTPSPTQPPAEPPLVSEPPRLPVQRTAPSSPEEAAAEADLQQVELTMQRFRDAVGENPTGTNAEITSALLGDNIKQAKIGPPENQQINDKGELVDRWGTPYFFHQLSKTQMEIRSAGPDRKMWTGDDKQL